MSKYSICEMCWGENLNLYKVIDILINECYVNLCLKCIEKSSVSGLGLKNDFEKAILKVTKEDKSLAEAFIFKKL